MSRDRAIKPGRLWLDCEPEDDEVDSEFDQGPEFDAEDYAHAASLADDRDQRGRDARAHQ